MSCLKSDGPSPLNSSRLDVRPAGAECSRERKGKEKEEEACAVSVPQATSQPNLGKDRLARAEVDGKCD